MSAQDFVADGSLLIAAPIAIAAGLVSFASPCVLPLVPGYLAYVGAVAGETSASAARDRGRGRIVAGALLFVAGFTAIFVLLMAAAGSVGTWLFMWQEQITRVMGVVIILMGLVFIGLLRPMQMTRKLRVKPRLGLYGAPMLGAVFAVGWTPCLGPTLATILSLSYQSGSVGRAVFLAILYCLGLALPFILTAIGVGWMTHATAFVKRHIRVVNIIGGALLIFIGALMATGLWATIVSQLQSLIDGYLTPI